jgi:5-amino-6-(5-phosphoribosylamino)uracil reductase
MRPFIICHMATSIDGRLHPSRFTSTAAGVSAEALRGHYEQVAVRFGAEGWIVGRKTERGGPARLRCIVG